jgi:Trypsin
MFTLRLWTRILSVIALLAAASMVRAQDVPQSLDDEYAQMAARVPGFGGLYLDERGTTHVYLQDLSRAGEMRGLGDRVVFQQGDYDFRDLQAWKDQVRPELSGTGAVYLDIDERRNRLVFGVEREAVDRFTEELQRFLGGTRVPPGAVIVEAAEPIQPLELVTDTIRPVPAGVQISSSVGFCTLGTNAVRAGVKGFITASHCTARQGVVDGTVFFQNAPGGGQIGVETVDPPFFTGGPCPSGRLCRRSDTAFSAYSSASFSAAAKIANPLFWGVSSGTLLTSLAMPRLPVASFLLGSVSSGSLVFKVGRTTGGTMGSVTNTCIDANVANSTVTMLCQDQAGALSAPGDSGSPVFVQSGGVATLAGILWGGNGSGSYVYSPWIFIFSELGGPNPIAP